MTTAMTKPINKFKPLTLAIAIALSSAAMQINAETMSEGDSASWQSPLAAEFSALDTSGNLLLLPNEASKGKAFSKNTFAKADANRDGYIDQDEYVYFKTGAWPVVAKPNVDANSDTSLPDSAQEMTTSEGDAMMPDESDTSQNRTVGAVIDDSVITTKAKAEILRTPDLKSLQISVDTRDGEVTLSGAVDNAAAKMKAEQVVSQIEGVKAVRNNLELN